MTTALSKKLDILETLAKNHNGLIKSSMLNDCKIFYRDILQFVHQGHLSKLKNGLYLFNFEKSESSLAGKISHLCRDGVLCMYTALSRYAYIDAYDKDPDVWDFAFDKDVSKARFLNNDFKIKPYYLEPEMLVEGVVKIKIDNQPFNIFTKDRLICECIKFEHKMNSHVFEKAFKRYLEDHEHNLTQLIRHCTKRNVLNKITKKLNLIPE